MLFSFLFCLNLVQLLISTILKIYLYQWLYLLVVYMYLHDDLYTYFQNFFEWYNNLFHLLFTNKILTVFITKYEDYYC